MFVICFGKVNHKSAEPMHWDGIGLTLSYSF